MNHAVQENVAETATPMTRMKSIAHTFRLQGNRKMMLVVNGNGKAEKNEYINDSFIDHKHYRFNAIDIPVSKEIKNELTKWVPLSSIVIVA